MDDIMNIVLAKAAMMFLKLPSASGGPLEERVRSLIQGRDYQRRKLRDKFNVSITTTTYGATFHVN